MCISHYDMCIILPPLPGRHVCKFVCMLHSSFFLLSHSPFHFMQYNGCGWWREMMLLTILLFLLGVLVVVYITLLLLSSSPIAYVSVLLLSLSWRASSSSWSWSSLLLLYSLFLRNNVNVCVPACVSYIIYYVCKYTFMIECKKCF